MTRLTWCLTTSVEGELRTIFPGAIDADDLKLIEPVVRRAVARRLQIEAASRNASEAAPPQPMRREPPKLAEIMTQGEIAKVKGYTGDCCDTCNQFTMKRNGACLSCDSCGTTTGCS